MRLLDELIAELCHELLATLRGNRHMRSLCITVAILAHEEFLDSHTAVEPHLQSQVSDPKATMTQLPLNAVFTMLQ